MDFFWLEKCDTADNNPFHYFRYEPIIYQFLFFISSDNGALLSWPNGLTPPLCKKVFGVFFVEQVSISSSFYEQLLHQYVYAGLTGIQPRA